MKAWLARHGPALLSAVLAGLAFPPFNVFLLVFAAIAPWLAQLRRMSGKEAVKSGFLFGFAYYLIQMFWVQLFVTDWLHKPVVAFIPYLITALLGGLLFMPLGWLLNLCWRNGRVWLVPFVWAAGEGLRAYVPALAFPWGLLGTPLARMPWMVQHAAFGGVFLVSAWVMVANLAVIQLLFTDKDGKRALTINQLRSLSAVFFLVFAAGILRLSNRPNTHKLVATLAQPGVDMAFTKGIERWQKLGESAKLAMATAETNGSQLVIFPEGFGEQTTGDTPISGVGARPAVPTILGSHRSDGKKVFQTAWLYDNGMWKQADKTRLVIFGEYVPFRDSPLLANFNLPTADISPGERVVTPTIDGTKVGTLICFEGVFPDLSEIHARNGAQMLVQISIDDWYIHTPAWEQLWMSSVYRSIETGLPMLRVGGEGMTLATDCRGQVIAAAKPFERQSLRVEVAVPDGSDAFPYKSAFLWLCYAVCGWVVVESVVKGKKKTDA